MKKFNKFTQKGFLALICAMILTIPNMKAYKNSIYLTTNKISDKWPQNVINLPIHSQVTLADAQKIVSCYHAYLNSIHHASRQKGL